MSKRRATVVGTAKAARGRWTTGTLALGRYPDGPITTPVNIACGATDGPTLWVQAAIHGTETGGAMGLLKLFRRLDLASMRGTIVGIMAANPSAFRGYSRNTPFDGENMNRLFPGNAAGGHSRRQASVLMETACAVADAVMDLHSGGDQAVVPFYALYWDDRSEASKRSRELALATGAKDLWRSSDTWLEGTMLANATRRGIPSVIVECGGGGSLPESEVDIFADAIEGVARQMGIVPGPARRRKAPREMTRCLLVFNRKGGYFVPAVGVGAIVDKGTVIARIMDPHGRVIEQIRSPNGPAYLAALARPYLPVYSGAMVAECVKVVQP
ncbi:MAG: succinylglutamate desuccinylase/aspartoacylase family protein [Burkholderiales bacterium]|nr:MAG: succinylglutamate desuccinylase/aspartoacylase family protein [Burkholderiales bacterium]